MLPPDTNTEYGGLELMVVFFFLINLIIYTLILLYVLLSRSFNYITSRFVQSCKETNGRIHSGNPIELSLQHGYVETLYSLI